MQRSILNDITPFSYLTEKQKQDLWRKSEIVTYKNGDIICSIDDHAIDFLFILISGAVKVKSGRKILSHIVAPSYFGELSVFFHQPRLANIYAENDITCLVVKGVIIKELVHQNVSFSTAFSSAIHNKLRIFQDYDSFIARLVNKKDEGFLRMADVVEVYKKLNPILHPYSNSDEIDFHALKYVIPRLPDGITHLSHIYLVEDLPSLIGELKFENKFDRLRGKKRVFLPLLPGKILINLLDDLSDYIAIITKLCVYYIETKKLRARFFAGHKKYEFFQRYYQYKTSGNKHNHSFEKLLPYTAHEKKELKAIFGENYYDAIYEILGQGGEINLSIRKQVMRYYILANETWINQIRHAFVDFLGENILDSSLDIHIISSNTHSVNNILSGWLQHHKNEILKWASANVHDIDNIENTYDKLYLAAMHWFKAFPDKLKDRSEHDLKHGIKYINDVALTGIDISIIDLDKLDDLRDPDLIKMKKKQRKTIIINVDYGYGRQSQVLMHNLILLFSHHIRSISIMGKCGGIIGNRGELIIPDFIMPQFNNTLQNLKMNDLSFDDFKDLNWDRPIHRGTMLTVLGTLMQSHVMLQYYKLFWSAVGMEMEGSYYLDEIKKAIINNNIPDDVKIRFIYYISDNPSNPHESLSRRLSYEEGGPAVYTITRAIVNKIFADTGE